MNNEAFDYRSAINAERWADVVRHAETDLQFNPASGELWHALAIALRAQKLDCVSAWENCALYLPELPSVQVSLGQTYVASGRFAEAVCCYDAALRLDPNSTVARFGLANALHARGELGAAITHYCAALSLRPDMGEALSGLIEALRDHTKLSQNTFAHITNRPHKYRWHSV